MKFAQADGLIAGVFLWIVFGVTGAVLLRVVNDPIPLWAWFLLVSLGVFTFIGGLGWFTVVKISSMFMWAVEHWTKEF